ncbi:MAG: YceI family protein, partial [Candidatus Limnocylindrales bacterium]
VPPVEAVRMSVIEPGQPARSRRRIATIVAAVIVALIVAGGGYGLWYLFLRPSGPAPVGGESLGVLPSLPASDASLPPTGIAGTWKVDTSIGSSADSTDSFVGYRVQEQLASIGANTAVGRTAGVSGSLTIAANALTATTITADLTTLQSDDQRRDGQLVRGGIQTGTYPTATFSLTAPIELGANPSAGREIDVVATGNLTLHGVTRSVQIPLKARLSGSIIEVVGSTTIVFTDYGIVKPTSFAVLSIADEGTLEFQVFFQHV